MDVTEEKFYKKLCIKFKITVAYIIISVPFSIFTFYILCAEKFQNQDNIICDTNICIVYVSFNFISYFIVGLWKKCFTHFVRIAKFLFIFLWPMYFGVLLFIPWILAIEKLVDIYKLKTKISHQKNFSGDWSYGYAEDENREGQDYTGYQEQQEETGKKQENNFFAGCNDKESLEKRYKALIKIYHPDSGNGDNDTFVEIKEQYEMLKTK